MYIFPLNPTYPYYTEDIDQIEHEIDIDQIHYIFMYRIFYAEYIPIL